jgi:hypothetical protein
MAFGFSFNARNMLTSGNIGLRRPGHMQPNFGSWHGRQRLSTKRQGWPSGVWIAWRHIHSLGSSRKARSSATTRSANHGINDGPRSWIRVWFASTFFRFRAPCIPARPRRTTPVQFVLWQVGEIAFDHFKRLVRFHRMRSHRRLDH